ncbi:MAG: NYN domain-containing protein, partial [Candidatus Omnitrophica bacterium]|nr:NYN domain-containing protein [Candidatus Omnitrophota bacterium]
HTLTGFIQYKEEREAFFKMLKKVGYIVKSKPVSSVYDSTSGDYKRKCNFDVEVSIIALDKLPEYKELVLCSGDGDFVKLLKYIKGKFKKTTVIAHRHRLNWELASTANRVITLESIKTELEKKKGLP